MPEGPKKPVQRPLSESSRAAEAQPLEPSSQRSTLRPTPSPFEAVSAPSTLRPPSGQMPAVRPNEPARRPSGSMRVPTESRRTPTLSMRKIDYGLLTPVTRVVEEILAIQAGERVLIAHDAAHTDVAEAFEHAVGDRRGKPTRVLIDDVAARPWASCPPALLDRVRESVATVLCISNEEGEYVMRHEFVAAVAAARARHVHMLGVSRQALLASLSAGCQRVLDLLSALSSTLRETTRISARSRAGTDLEVELGGTQRWFENGRLVSAGHWVNVPFGSLITSPHRVRGVFVADAAMGGGVGAKAGLLARAPLKLTIDDGVVRSVDCQDFQVRRAAERFIAEGRGHERVGLVSLGANVGCLSPLGEIVHDENMPGLHVALGDPFPSQTGAEWESFGQLPLAMAEADVDLDGRALIRRGRYVRFV